MWRGIETDLLRKSSPFAMRLQERPRKGTRASLAFSPSYMNGVQAVNVGVLVSVNLSYRRLREKSSYRVAKRV